MKRILVVGCSGRLGHYVVEALKREGHFVRGLCPDFNAFPEVASHCNEAVSADLTKPESIHDVCKTMDIVFSAAGASLDPKAVGDRSSYFSVDYLGNVNLLKEAKRSGVKRFVYVSVFGAQNNRHLTYADAHERFVDELKSSGISYGVMRPTGFFGVFKEIFDMAAALGRAVQIGNGSARTNPIHEADLADACVEMMFGSDTEQDIGGPEVLTRLRTTELAFEALGKLPKISDIPPTVFKTAGMLVRPINKRIHDLLDFGREVSLSEVVAPKYGSRKLAEYYAELVASEKKESSSE